MRRWLWFVVLVALMALVAASSAGAESVSGTAGSNKKLPRVSRVIDGDTIRLTNGRSVRLLQIDTPELQENECYGRQAKQALARLLPRGTRVTLQSDPGLDKVDQYGRLLRYVIKRGTNLNIQLVRLGAASVWFYQGEQGRYASQLLAAAEAAQASSRGLWASCPGTVFDPTQAVDTRPANPPPVSACSDGIDNDIDGLIDYPADPGCASSTDTDETNMAAAACADGLDNDTDGLTDYPADTGCSNATDTLETTSSYQCDDGLDNNGNGLIDYPDDSACSGATDTTEATTGNCDPAYPGVCIPPPPPDLDCGDISYTNFTVLAPDPHNFDGDHDGVGCET